MVSQRFPFYQPIIETATGRIVGYEALARTTEPGGKIVSAGDSFTDQLVPILERIEWDRSIRRQTMEQLHLLPPNTFISINISPEWIQHLDTLDALPTLEMVEEAGVDPARVIIEITESEGDLHLLEQLVNRYRELGMQVALDDFGNGYSQLDRIAVLKPDYVKLNIQHLREGADAGRGVSLVQQLSMIASRLGCKVMCKGVETEDDFFLALSCQAVCTQGFLFSPAQQNMLDPESTVEKASELLNYYRDMATELVARNHWRAEKAKGELLGLREVLRTTPSDEELIQFVPSEHFLRFYICDLSGNQVSPNFENSDRGWIINEAPKGSNWSWRPYFFELLGASDLHSRVVFSAPYQDIHSGKQAQTAVMFIDEQRILLADMLDTQKANETLSGFSAMPASWVPGLET
ncbi:EAL domain-containing protein [Neptunomonas sp.]|uniref:EAL domain-containing protein n=1 Tax=Neptunomonas TaxID=75687 RepID=UPI003513BF86